MKKKLIIIGNGLLAELAYTYFEKHSIYKVISFACDKSFIKEKTLFDIPIIEIKDVIDNFSPKKYFIFIAIGYRNLNKIREKLFNYFDLIGYKFANFIHPSVEKWESNFIGKNNFVFENNVIQPFVIFGDNNIIWSGNHIGHHTKIGNHNFISSHVVISGNCELKNNIFLGVNSTIIDGIIVKDENFIDAGVTIKNHTKKNEFYRSNKFDSHKLTTDKLRFLT